MVGALGYWFILILPYKSIAKRSYQLQKPEDTLSHIKYNYHTISWCYSEDIYSNGSLLGAMKGKFYTTKQLWRLCQSLYCLRPASASSIRLCLTLFPTLFLRFYYSDMLYVLWFKLPYMLLASHKGSRWSRSRAVELGAPHHMVTWVKTQEWPKSRLKEH